MTKKEFEEWRDENDGDWGELISLAQENNSHLLDNIVDDDYINDRIKKMVDEGYDWSVIQSFLSGLDYSDDYYIVDGYANMQNVSPDDWDMYADDLENEIDFDEDDEEITDSIRKHRKAHDLIRPRKYHR